MKEWADRTNPKIIAFVAGIIVAKPVWNDQKFVQLFPDSLARLLLSQKDSYSLREIYAKIVTAVKQDPDCVLEYVFPKLHQDSLNENLQLEYLRKSLEPWINDFLCDSSLRLPIWFKLAIFKFLREENLKKDLKYIKIPPFDLESICYLFENKYASNAKGIITSWNKGQNTAITEANFGNSLSKFWLHYMRDLEQKETISRPREYYSPEKAEAIFWTHFKQSASGSGTLDKVLLRYLAKDWCLANPKNTDAYLIKGEVVLGHIDGMLVCGFTFNNSRNVTEIRGNSSNNQNMASNLAFQIQKKLTEMELTVSDSFLDNDRTRPLDTEFKKLLLLDSAIQSVPDTLSKEELIDLVDFIFTNDLQEFQAFGTKGVDPRIARVYILARRNNIAWGCSFMFELRTWDTLAFPISILQKDKTINSGSESTHFNSILNYSFDTFTEALGQIDIRFDNLNFAKTSDIYLLTRFPNLEKARDITISVLPNDTTASGNISNPKTNLDHFQKLKTARKITIELPEGVDLPLIFPSLTSISELADNCDYSQYFPNLERIDNFTLSSENDLRVLESFPKLREITTLTVVGQCQQLLKSFGEINFLKCVVMNQV